MNCSRSVAVTALAGSLALLGCGRSLVFVKVNDNIAYRAQAAGKCPVQSGDTKGVDNVDALIEAGDQLRDHLPRPIALEPSGPVDEQEIEDLVKQRKAKAQQHVDLAYRTWRDAQACYEAAARLDPSSSYAFLNLGFIAIKMSDLVTEPSARAEFLTRAQTNLNRAKELNRFDGQAQYYEAELHVRRGNNEQAERILQGLLAKKWNRANVHNLLGFIYAVTGRREAATAAWTSASQVDTPPEATDWALTALRPLKKRKFENDEDDADPKEYFRWDPTVKRLNSISAPQSPCGWAANGRQRC